MKLKKGSNMITEILDYLNKSPNTYTSSTRIMKKVEKIPHYESTNARKYGRRLSFMSKLGLVEKNDKQRKGWKITDKGKKWLDNEIDLREL